MFKKKLTDALKTIFEIHKVTYDLPSSDQEQECLFISIESAKISVKNGMECAQVQGSIIMYANGDKLPFGFFSKKVNQADPSLTRDLFFYNLDENTRTFLNIVERRCEFHFLIFRGL